MEDEFLTVEEIAKQLKVKKITIREWIRKGDLQAYKMGRIYRIHKKDYEEFLKKHRAG